MWNYSTIIVPFSIDFYIIMILNLAIIVNEIVLFLFLKQAWKQLDYIMNMQFKMKLIIFQNIYIYVYPFVKIAFWPTNTFFYGLNSK